MLLTSVKFCLPTCTKVEMSAPPESSPAPSGSSSGTPAPSWAGRIEDGENYRVIRGKKAKSNIIVAGDKSYLIEKTVPDTSSAESVRYVYYLRCQDHDCLARAVIRRNVLDEKTSELKRHTCGNGSAILDKIAIQEALNRMKMRARQEGTTYYVR